MADKGPCVRAGHIGGVIWPVLIHDGVNKAQAICERSTLQEGGLLSEGLRGTLYNSDLLNPAWVAPEDLQIPLRSEDIADQSLRYYRAQYPEEFVPLPLLRELLEEAAHLDDLASNASLLGNRVAATWLGSEELLICSTAGDIGQTLRLSVLHGSHVDQFQCEGTAQAACSGMPIWQVCFNRPCDADDALMVAVRTPYWLCFFSLEKGRSQADAGEVHDDAGPSSGLSGGAKRWTLQPVGALQTKQRLAHVSWNRKLPNLAAFTCEDGSLHTVDVAEEGQCTASLSVSSFALLQAKEVAGPLQPRPRFGRLVCEWAAHPTGLLMAAGQQLLRYDISMPGASAIPRTLHTLGPSNAFIALSAPAETLGDRGNSDHAHLLAASTLREVLLLDLRNPGQALLRWHHGMDREPPQLLALLPAPQEMAVSREEHPQPTTPAPQPHLQQSPLQRERERATGNDQADVGPSQFDALQSQYGSSSQLPDDLTPGPRSMQHHQPDTQASQLGGLDELFAPQASQMGPAAGFRDLLGTPAREEVRGQQQLQEGRSGAPRLKGFVAAANLGVGDVISCAFAIRAQQLGLHAQPPAALEGAPSTDAEPLFGRILAYAGSMSPLLGSRQDGESGSGAVVGGGAGEGAPEEQALLRQHGQRAGFSWVPRSLANAQSLGLPRRICWPLQLHARPEEVVAGVASPEAAKELEALLKDAPDLQGIAFVAPAPDDLTALQRQPGSGGHCIESALMLRLDFLGHLHLQGFRLPWATKQPAASLKEVGVEEHRSALASIIQRRHPSLQADYVIGKEVSLEKNAEEGSYSDLLRAAEQPDGLTEKDLICDLSIHHGIARKAMQDWKHSAGDGGISEHGASRSAQRELLSQLLAETKVKAFLSPTQVPLTVWEVCMELQKMQQGTALEEASEEDAGATSPGMLECKGGERRALRRRMGSIRQGVQAIEVGRGQQARLSKWEKARSDPRSIMGNCFLNAHSEVEEDAAGLPSQIRDVTAALSAALYEADLPHGKDAPMRCAFTDGLSNPASTSLLHSGDRKAQAEAEEVGPDSQMTTASQEVSMHSSELPPDNVARPPIDRILGNGLVLTPQTRLQSMFGVPVRTSVLEPQIIMQRTKVVDPITADALADLETDWLQAEGNLQPSSTPGQKDPASAHGHQVSGDRLLLTQQSTPATQQKRVSFAPGSQLPSGARPSGRQAKRNRISQEEGFS